MKKSLKAAFLYIGTAIGAGFSSGREIAVFFGDCSPLNVAFASVFMALLCCLFLIAGKLDLMPKGRIAGFGIFFSAAISLCSMLAGGEFVMRSLSGIPLLGLIMAILGGVIVILGIEKIKLLNSILVPLIVLSIFLIFRNLDAYPYSLPFSISKPLLYSGLDVLLGGVVMAEEGKKLNMRQIFLSTLIIAACLFVMLFMLQSVVLADEAHSLMPVLAVAEKFRLKAVCGALIAAAIFTTLVSSLKIVSDKVLSALNSIKRLSPMNEKNARPIIVFLCLTLAYPISFWGFDNIVDTLYPIMSFSGIILTAIVILRSLLYAILKIRDRMAKKSNTGIKNEKILYVFEG